MTQRDCAILFMWMSISNFSISMIADFFNMRPSCFSKRFKKPPDYIHRQTLTLIKKIMDEQPETMFKSPCDQADIPLH